MNLEELKKLLAVYKARLCRINAGMEAATASQLHKLKDSIRELEFKLKLASKNKTTKNS